jgi:threonine dehydrogenase-like Zn-dependent dehydrogenase
MLVERAIVYRHGGSRELEAYDDKEDVIPLRRDEEWGVGMAEKDIVTGLCPGGHLRLSRLLRLLKTGRLDPTPMTTHTFGFDEIQKAFRMMDEKEDGMIKPLIDFGG